MPPNEAFITQFNQTLADSAVNIKQLATLLDAADATERRRAVHALSGKMQAELFEAAAAAPKLTLDDIVPRSIAPFTPVTHEGRNSLAVFRDFAKVFLRPSPTETVLWGYNRTNKFVTSVVGPGYYVAYEQERHVVVDYRTLPSVAPQDWPALRPNSSRLSRFVYHGLVDILRRVSTHVSIGRATRNGQFVDNWFVLCR